MGWLRVPHQPDSPPRPGSHDDRQVLAQNLRRLFQRKFHINKSFTSLKLTVGWQTNPTTSVIHVQ